MLTDDPHRKELPSLRSRSVKSKKSNWSDSQKIEAVTTYLALGEVRLTASVLKIPEVTLHNWKSKDWWKEIESELRHQENLQLSVRLQRIVGSALTAVEDRLQNGDFIYDQKTGALVRKPVAMKDAHKVSMEMIEKRDVLINKVPTILSAEALDDKLEKLAAKFIQIAQSVKAPITVTDVIFEDSMSLSPPPGEADEDEEDVDFIDYKDEDDAIYEGRETGLQA